MLAIIFSHFDTYFNKDLHWYPHDCTSHTEMAVEVFSAHLKVSTEQAAAVGLSKVNPEENIGV